MKYLLLFAVLLASRAPAAVAWKDVLKQPADWYGSPEAATIGYQVLAYQFDNGGWPKNRDMTRPPPETLPHDGKAHDDLTHATIDNDATTTQIRLLARLHASRPEPRFKDAVYQGIHYLLRAQYPNGGWPQFYPNPEGYAKHITFNDDAMINVLELLTEVADRREPYAFLDVASRQEASEAVERGTACLLACQVIREGKRTAWCAQHDEHSLAPAPARTFEPASLSGYESVRIVRFLMKRPHPTQEEIAAIEGAIAWFRQVQLNGLRVVTTPAPGAPHGIDVHVERDPSAPPQWARFYELGTDRPLFSDRDSLLKYRLADIGIERRTGYRWYVHEPARLLEKDYPAWRRRLQDSHP